jgi:hypothetical protein
MLTSREHPKPGAGEAQAQRQLACGAADLQGRDGAQPPGLAAGVERRRRQEPRHLRASTDLQTLESMQLVYMCTFAGGTSSSLEGARS